MSLEFIHLFDDPLLKIFNDTTKIILPCAPLRYTWEQPSIKMHTWFNFKYKDL